MAVSSLNKEVATRLFRMLAVNEQKMDSVKRDHSSYAKLSLLTQQVNLLQYQAQRVVDKSAVKVIDVGSPQLSENCTTLSTEYDEGAKRLLSMISIDESRLAAVKSDSTACAKLSILAEQVGMLQAQAKEVVDDAEVNRLLTEIGMSCRIVPGTVYYHYTQNGKDTLSRIADDEWDCYDEFHGKYFYDFDFTFRKLGHELGGTDSPMDFGMAQTILLPRLLSDESTDSKTTASADHIMEEPTGINIPAALEAQTPICGRLSRW
eukprot:CAMPEP_0183351454 /NCGR_PEP_ID=MMETSP0164_2-20130417/24988_1 /TAXON_ID=221442 /ORGANISM="Coccolithus pelagicus ssp braarudi, Strain PLY182g" /LENGTH=262 /DNA_ID=CAMNT_0025523643 /DNA_START=96 /DNA_END=884 /DNA_ORIENTATION=+